GDNPDGGSVDNPGTGGSTNPPPVFAGSPPGSGPGAAPGPGIQTTGDGDTKFPVAGVDTAADGGLLGSTLSRWLLALAGLGAVAGGWVTGVRALRRNR